MDKKIKKKTAQDFGHFAEEITSQEYIRRGYVILERNWRLGKTEIDIIAQKENTVVIVEVKGRSGRDEDALSTVKRDKRKRMIKAADSYIKRFKGEFDYRFDIAAITGDKDNYDLDIIEDAFVSADIF